MTDQATAISDGRSELEALLERVRAATGPDREIDCLLGAFTDLIVDGQAWRPIMAHGIEFAVGLASRYQSVWFTALPYYSSSIDAALALVERKLPNAMKRVLDTDDGQSVHADIVLEMGGHFVGYGATWPLAILATLLSALAQEQT